MQLYDLHFIARRLRERALESTANVPRNVTPPLDAAELVTLGQLREFGPSSISQIAQRGNFAQSRISWAVARLRDQRGWVETSPDPNDRRATQVKLKSGRAARIDACLSTDASDALEPLLRSATATERAAALRGLEILLRCLRSDDDR